MFRFRRYRMLLICAFVITMLLYHVSKNSQWDRSSEFWHGGAGLNVEERPRPYSPPASEPVHGHDHNNQAGTDVGTNGDEHTFGPHDIDHPEEPQRGSPPPPAPSTLDPESTIQIAQLKSVDQEGAGYGLPTKAPTVPGWKTPNNHAEPQEQNKVVSTEAAATTSTIHWQKPKEWFPVPKESIIPLPTGKPQAIPAIQFAFAEESPTDKEIRLGRLAKIKTEAQRAWSGYREYAWTHDELKPVSKKSKDPFCGWAATLVDTLDTLWIMGMKDEFDEAVEAVRDIDFTTTPYRDDIPVFETIIRYLGGMVGAYDMTGGDPKYRILLDKAVELAEILMGVFDTPNRLPILYYNWKPSYNKNPRRASSHSGVAEIGSMTMEFTRLAQLTGEDKYYDAIARIVDALEELQNREHGTAIPGLFPEHLDASGCNRSAPLPPGPQHNSPGTPEQVVVPPPPNTGFRRGPQARRREPRQKRAATPNNGPTTRDPEEFPPGWECVPQNLTVGGWGGGSFSMGGNQDSTYEYFPKQYLMLGGLEPKYRTMHEKTADAVKEYLLFRPMAEGDPDILFSAKAYSSDGTTKKMTYEFEVTHLTCFLGGMFGLGGKIFNRPEDVEIGERLTDGCVWAYESMPAGVMPEHSFVVPCKDPTDCHFDKTTWYRAIDPTSQETRDQQMEDYKANMAKWKVNVEKAKAENALAEERRRLAAVAPARANDETEVVGSTKTSPVERSTLETRDFPSYETAPKPGGKLQDIMDAASNNVITVADQQPLDEMPLPIEPLRPLTHLEYVEDRIKKDHIPPGFSNLRDKRYILRPEAIESVWYMYRITGDRSWQEKGWRMFEAVIRATRTDVAHTAIRDVTTKEPGNEADMEDSMESFWLAETLKYFYLLFETPDVVSLDEWVLNTEAHPFRRPK
ncbi:glycosyl hydrolase family 47-domain-containing protein [Dichotomopilus funicola]|uniref:alpha-1,2-Mannosidase n=1 Tax=Dichotomopilus funicola TaxID=1934379 RepID=A0AAN6ZK08_9PEZI|nr:glycosyl hydrolase family 47-domain-containing protein [Dichotomopilus funicola]